MLSGFLAYHLQDKSEKEGKKKRRLLGSKLRYTNLSSTEDSIACPSTTKTEPQLRREPSIFTH